MNRNIIRKDGSIFQINLSDFPLNLYPSLVIDHISENENLSEDFFNQEMKDFNTIKQTEQCSFGQSLLPDLINGMGIRNLELSAQGVIVNTISIAQDNAGLKLLLETGALRTAIGLGTQLKQKYNTHASVYNDMIAEIDLFLYERGF